MTTEKMKELLSAKDEKITIEYKSCTNEISESVYETVSSFSNRYGGWIIMGVKDGGIPIGVNRNAAKDMRRNFVSQLNNTNKMSPTLYIEIEEFEYQDKLLLWTYVPPASTVIKCSGRVYDRNDEGDFDITDSPIQMENMYARKTGAFSENKLFPYATEDDLRMDLMPRVRRLIENKNAQHEWLKMSDHEIMISAGLYEKNLVTGEKGYNLAAIMLFGKDEVIRSCVSGYVTDAIYRVENVDRYDDRLQVNTNLIESYDKLMEFVAKHTSDKFCLIDNVSTSIRDVIAREVVSNILVHRDFSSAYPAKLIIEKDWLRTENWLSWSARALATNSQTRMVWRITSSIASSKAQNTTLPARLSIILRVSAAKSMPIPPKRKPPFTLPHCATTSTPPSTYSRRWCFILLSIRKKLTKKLLSF